jgi:Ser/Thr protein kinase RdoA (MazF antagonist)
MQENYQHLSPDMILNAIESQGFVVSARMLSLNSYENRVLQIGLEENDEGIEETIIAKFYRPQRWSNEQILEEHEFSEQLQAQEIPVVAPIKNNKGETLFEYNGFRFALFPRKGGYAPEPGNIEQLERLGVLLGRIHQYGQEQTFKARDSISLEKNLIEPTKFLLNHDFIPEDLKPNYQNICEALQEKITHRTQNFSNTHFIKCHGDWHLGNILWRDERGGHIVDLDDCVNGPAMQDIWMMLSGEPQDQALQLRSVLKGYEQFCFFDRSQLNLLESLRTMRIIFYSAWLAKRWEDPAFPKNFPWFDSRAYWQQHMRELQDQIPLIDSNLFADW